MSHEERALASGARVPVRDAVDRSVLWACRQIARRATTGTLQLTLPSGRVGTLGAGDVGAAAAVTISRYRALWSTITRGGNGFAERYMGQDIECDDLHALFNFYLDNTAALAVTDYGVLGYSWRDRLFHRRRRNTRTGSRRNIAAHYDLGNDFYRLWLDADMTYSSGVFTAGAQSLEAAQAEKYQRIIAALEIEQGSAVLEIGCGWGAFAIAAARAGAEVTAITISEQQRVEARERAKSSGAGDKIAVKFEDYRDTVGTYDRIASIEMIEAVGEENWATYFKVIADRLRPGGNAVIQAITVRPDLYDVYRRNPDFIQRFIFPGGMLPTEAALERHSREAGLLFEPVETFALSYARTLALWRQRFLEAWPRITALGFDERFRRMWIYYLTYCEVGFQRGTIDVGLYRFRKP